MRVMLAVMLACGAFVTGATGTAMKGAIPLGEPANIVDTLGAATPTTTFGIAPGGQVISAYQRLGPRFVLTQPTVVTEIGAFVNIMAGGFDTMPLMVSIVRAGVDGLPNVADIVGDYILTDDGNLSLFSYEWTQPNCLLDPGTYFSLFSGQNENYWGVLLANDVGYEAGSTWMGMWVPWWESPVVNEYQGAVRILGHVPTAEELVVDLIDFVNSFQIGTLGKSLTDKLVTVQRMLAAGKDRQACENLEAFNAQVVAQRDKALTSAQADSLTTGALRIKGVIGY